MGNVYQDVANTLTVLKANFAKKGIAPTAAKGHEIAPSRQIIGEFAEKINVTTSESVVIQTKIVPKDSRVTNGNVSKLDAKMTRLVGKSGQISRVSEGNV